MDNPVMIKPIFTMLNMKEIIKKNIAVTDKTMYCLYSCHRDNILFTKYKGKNQLRFYFIDADTNL